VELAVDVDLLDAPTTRRIGKPGLDLRSDIPDPGVAGKRQRPLPDQLHPGIGLRVVGGGDHRAAVQFPRSDQVIEHLRRHHSGVQDLGSLGGQSLGDAAGNLRGLEPHVAPQADPELGRLLAGESGQHPGEAATDELRDVAVDLGAVQAADVVGLEDSRGDGAGAAGGLGQAEKPPLRAS
jgi:hypothetical protein